MKIGVFLSFIKILEWAEILGVEGHLDPLMSFQKELGNLGRVGAVVFHQPVHPFLNLWEIFPSVGEQRVEDDDVEGAETVEPSSFAQPGLDDVEGI